MSATSAKPFRLGGERVGGRRGGGRAGGGGQPREEEIAARLLFSTLATSWDRSKNSSPYRTNSEPAFDERKTVPKGVRTKNRSRMKRPRDKMTKRSLMGDLEGKMRRTTFSIFTTDRSNVLEIYETIDSISLHWCVSKQHAEACNVIFLNV